MELNVLRDKALEIAKKKGWNDGSYKHYICLVVSELMEAVEAYRKLKVANKIGYLDNTDKTKIVASIERFGDDFYNGILVGAFQTFIKDTVEDELADTFIRLLHLAGLSNIDLEKDLNIGSYYSEEDYNTFTEWVFTVCKNIFGYNVNRFQVIEDTMSYIIGYCNHHNIDLEFHIKEKMRYIEIYNHNKINELCSFNHED